MKKTLSKSIMRNEGTTTKKNKQQVTTDTMKGKLRERQEERQRERERH